MKKLTALIVIMLLFCATSVYSQNSSNLEGVWKLIYQKFETPDRIIERDQDWETHLIVASGDKLSESDPFKNPFYMILAEKHFSFCGLDQGNERFVGRFGEYSYDGDTYTEHIKYSTDAPLKGQTVKMKSNMDGKNWTIEGVYIIQGEEIKFKETWQRVE